MKPNPVALATAADVQHVREVSLAGVADLDYWRARLAEDDLEPKGVDGRAGIQIVAAELRFWGVTFREISFSVWVLGSDLPDGSSFCVGAVNTNRVFAFFERAWFHAPYDAGDVAVSLTPPSFALGHTVSAVLGSARAATTEGPYTWSGPVLLPGPSRGKPRGNLFEATLEGLTATYPFDPARDRFALEPDASAPAVVRALADSHFVPTGWQIRSDARHRKSVTARRSDVFPVGHGRS